MTSHEPENCMVEEAPDMIKNSELRLHVLWSLIWFATEIRNDVWVFLEGLFCLLWNKREQGGVKRPKQGDYRVTAEVNML